MNMTSGSISDLLSRPKPWSQLSWKGRESYTKMAEFLDDPAAMEQLKVGSFNGRIAQQYNNNLQKLQNSDEITVKDYVVSRTVNNNNSNEIKTILNNTTTLNGFNNTPNANSRSVNCSNNSYGEENSLKRKLKTDSETEIMNSSAGLGFSASGKKIPVSY